MSKYDEVAERLTNNPKEGYDVLFSASSTNDPLPQYLSDEITDYVVYHYTRLPINIIGIWGKQPYKTEKEMFKDIETKNQLIVPLDFCPKYLSLKQYTMGRALHDYDHYKSRLGMSLSDECKLAAISANKAIKFGASPQLANFLFSEIALQACFYAITHRFMYEQLYVINYPFYVL